MLDESEHIASETPTLYEDARLERVYEFNDGAVVRYEWQDISLGGFNHRFTLAKPPQPNPESLEPGVLKEIPY